MALAALIAGWSLAGPASRNCAFEPTPLARAGAWDSHNSDAASPRRQVFELGIGGRQAGPTVAMLGDIDDEDESSPSPVLPPISRHEVGLVWLRIQARPGVGQVGQVSTGRIPLRC